MPFQANFRLHREGKATAFIADLWVGLTMWDLWRTFAWDEMQQRYRRSAIGVLWIVLSYAIFVAGVSIFFSAFTAADPLRYVTYVAIGFAAFTFLSGNIIDGCQVFISSSTWIKSVNLPYSIHVYRSIFRSIFILALQMTIAFVVLIASGWRPSHITFMIVPALFVYILNAVPLQYAIGLLSARYRDIIHLVSSVTRLLIFITPILWVREELTGIRANLADINPLAHFIEIFRAPLMGVEPRITSWIVVIALTGGVWAAAFIISARMRQRLAYWL